MEIDPTPTQNQVWKKYTLTYSPFTHKVIVAVKGTSMVRTITREYAKQMLTRDDGFYSHKDLGVPLNQFYTEILKLYERMEKPQE